MILLPFTRLGWVSKDKWGQKEVENKAATYLAQSKIAFHVRMVQKLFCVTTFGVSFLQLQLRKYAVELQNTLGSQQGLALHIWQHAGTRPTADYV